MLINGLSIIYILKLCNAVMQCHCEPIESYCTILLALMVPRCDGLNSLIIRDEPIAEIAD